MNNYAISSCLVEKTSEDKKIITGILNRIADDETPYKVVVDKGGVIFDIYERIANNNNVHVASWLRVLTRHPKQIEYLDLKLEPNQSDIFKFLETASKIRNEKKLILYSHNLMPEDIMYMDGNKVKYNSEVIRVYDSNEAMQEFNNHNGITIMNKNELNQTTTNKTENISDSFVSKGNSKNKNIKFINKSKLLTKENLIIVLVIGILASLIAAWLWSKM